MFLGIFKMVWTASLDSQTLVRPLHQRRQTQELGMRGEG